MSAGRVMDSMGNGYTSFQSSLGSGELTPSIWGRTDLDKYAHGTTTSRNFFVNYRGGVSTRAGLAYVGTCKQSGTSPPPRDIPFQFSVTQGYVLEFGEHYLRVKTNGAYVTEASKSSSVSSSAVFTVTSHGYSSGDWVFDTGNTGFSGLTWIVSSTTTNTFTVTDLFGTPVTSATVTSGGTVARIYTVVAPYAAIDLPYLKYTQSADVMTLTCINTSASTEYPPYDLARHSNTNWVFTQETFGAVIASPTGLSIVAQSSDTVTTWYSYVITAVDSSTGEESVASLPVSVQNNDIAISAGSNTVTWSAVANASSYNIYAATPSYSYQVQASSLYGFVGTSLGPSFTDTNIVPDFTQVPPVHSNPFARGAILDVIPAVNGANYFQSTIGYTLSSGTGSGFSGTPIASGGKFVGFIINNPGQGYTNSDTMTITDSGGGVATGFMQWAANPADGDTVTFNSFVFGFRNVAHSDTDVQLQANLALTLQTFANQLNAFTQVSISVASYQSSSNQIIVTYKTPGTAGNAYTLAGPVVSGATLAGGGAMGGGALATLTVGPQSGTYPAVCAYFQQRRVYASSLNQPDTYWMTKPGLFHNMDSSIPVTASDAIIGTPWAQQVNGIQWLVPMPGGLVVLTGKGAWQVNGGGSAAITPSTQTATPQAYNGANGLVVPFTENYDIIYIQSKGTSARDLAYNFFTNIYTGTDLTILSNHLFLNYQLLQGAWCEEPYRLAWFIRNDGILLCLTYLKEQEVYSWTRHDTNGLFVSVCSVTEPPVDSLYVITKRYVRGGWRYYSERMDDRLWNNVEEVFCSDSALTTGLVFPQADLQAGASTGNGVLFTVSFTSFFPSQASIGSVIRTGGGKAVIKTYISGTQVLADIVEPITSVIYDNSSEMPVPAPAGTWTLTDPATTVSGLNHLEGLSVAILADGSVIPNQTVTNGSVTLPYPASYRTIGLPYTCQVQTIFIDHPDNGNTVQTRRKKISSVGLRVESTRGIQVGADQEDQSEQPNFAPTTWSNMSELKQRTPMNFAGVAVPLYTGDLYKNIDSSWSVKGQMAIQQTYPLPANILGLAAYWDQGDDG